MGKKWLNFNKPKDLELKELLTKEQFNVTQKNWTESPFTGVYWNYKGEGIYVDAVSGEPLFSSKDKFDSRCGWPSFSNSLEKENIIEKEDFSNFMYRIEVRSKHGDSHLGHVFDDGPETNSIRYCINSASLRFVSKEKMVEEGYEDYLYLFEN